MTAQGTPLTRFRRAIETSSLLAELAAREAGWLPLEDTLALAALYARLDDDKFDRAAVTDEAAEAVELRLEPPAATARDRSRSREHWSRQPQHQ